MAPKSRQNPCKVVRRYQFYGAVWVAIFERTELWDPLCRQFKMGVQKFERTKNKALST